MHLPLSCRKMLRMGSYNLGDGLVTDLITDLNGNPAQTLEEYLSEHGLDAVIQDAVSNLAFFCGHR